MRWVFVFFRGVNYFANILWICFSRVRSSSLLFSIPDIDACAHSRGTNKSSPEEKLLGSRIGFSLKFSTLFRQWARRQFLLRTCSVRVWLRNFTRISAYWRYAFLFCLYVYEMVFFVSAEISHKRELINLWLVRTCRGCWNLRCHFSLRFYLEVCALKVPVADFSVFFGNPKFGF